MGDHNDAKSESSASTQDSAVEDNASLPHGRISVATAENRGDDAAATSELGSDVMGRLSEPELVCDQRATRRVATTALETLGESESKRCSEENDIVERVEPPIVYEMALDDDAASANYVAQCVTTSACAREKRAACTISTWWRSSRQPESELAKILAFRRAATTHENEPARYVAHDKPDSRKVSFADEIGAPLEERHSGGSADQCAPKERRELVSDVKVARFDFGVGLVRGCVACGSKLPRLNRGCKACQKRVCRKCFSTHACSVLASAHGLSAEDARSTPSIRC